ncbi:hypothetical protein [Glycocaulis sp.]|uniref:hypothetical protein n=1 Tax=Glycocaulis sp. TaxID=1969725 RepID=UPI003D1B691C
MSDQNSSQGVQYQQRIVAFLDILGFRDLVIRSESDQNAFNKVIDSIIKIKRIADVRPTGYDYHASTFSDNIAISAKIDVESLHYIFISIEALTTNLMQIGCLCRGSVVVGNLVHNENMVFGRGLVSAHDFENRLAKYPRIVLDDNIVDMVRQLTPEDTLGAMKRKLFRDFDGMYCMHYLNDLADIDINIPIKENPKLIVAYTTSYYMNKSIESCTSDPSAFEKYRYFSDYWRDAVDSPQALSGRGLIPEISIPQSLLDRRRRPFKTGID